jgi:type I restriction enzyme R subunit
VAFTDLNSEDRLVQHTFAEHLEHKLGWESVYAYNTETFGPEGTLGRADTREAVLTRDLRAALARLNPQLPPVALDEAVRALTRHDFSRSLLQHNQEFYHFLRDGVPVRYKDAAGQLRDIRARVIDFANGHAADGAPHNRFVAVRELKLTGLRAPHYNRRADLVCFVNGLPLVFIELKAVHKNIRDGFEHNLRDYLEPHTIPHAFHHNAFLVVSNGDRARYGSITSKWEHFAEWKRQSEDDKGKLDAQALLDGMLAPARLLDLVENFILFDASKPGHPRKVVARNHQVLGVNKAVEAVRRQEELRQEFPAEKRLVYRQVSLASAPLAAEPPLAGDSTYEVAAREAEEEQQSLELLDIVERAHPELGRLGVVWHTQGSGKSYSMLFFAEKVRRRVSAKFTFLLMTDRTDLDGQIYGTFVGCGVADEQTPRASTGAELKRLLKQNHRHIFSLIHKFNQDVNPLEPYSERDDIIVISDEAHRTQSGKLAVNMRLALPNAAFIGFTGTPLFKNNQLTKRIFGGYVSKYDFKRSEEDGSTVKLVYENRGEKLGITRLDLNDRIADAIAKAELDPDQEARLEKLLGKDYEIITARDRLNKVAKDFVEHCATRWESGKSMLVCIDKITAGRMTKQVRRFWKVKLARLRLQLAAAEAALAQVTEETEREILADAVARLRAQTDWMAETLIQLIVSEGQNEIADFQAWGVDVIPHRVLMKTGFETPDGKRVDVEKAFKNPAHPFRVAVVCAMWLTGFDVECLSTLYIDKPMKAHTLMQAIARANRVYPGKDFGLIVDYNGMLKSLRAALAQYALGDGGDAGQEIIAPIEERVRALHEALAETEAHLRACGFNPARLAGAKGFVRIEAIKDGADAVTAGRDEGRRRFEIMARQVFIRFKALLMEPAAHAYAERHDNIEAIYKKLEERRDAADITALLKELQRLVNDAVRTAEPGDDQADARLFDLSRINLEKLRAEFAKRVTRKATVLEDIRQLVERKLQQLLARNPQRMDYYRRYTEIVAEYNHDKDRVSIEDTFAKLVELDASLDAEGRRAAEQGLSEDEYALFCLLKKDKLTSAERETLKLGSRDLYTKLCGLLAVRERWTEKEQTQAEVETLILDHVFTLLPTPPFTDEEKQTLADQVYRHVWSQSESGRFGAAA